MLGTMTVFAIVSRLLLSVKEVLAHNPLSIAGTATMVAGGKITPESAMDMEYESRTYSLKWWQDDEGKKRYGVDVD